MREPIKNKSMLAMVAPGCYKTCLAKLRIAFA